jgi:hypothetical protein
MAKYIVSRGAKADIDEIAAYIAADNVDAALTFESPDCEPFSNAGRQLETRTGTP